MNNTLLHTGAVAVDVLSRRDEQAQATDVSAAESHLSVYVLCLTTVLLLSSLGLVYTKYVNRKLFIQSQHLRHAYARGHSERGRLLLEYGALTSQHRIQQVAHLQLAMHRPTKAQTHNFVA